MFSIKISKNLQNQDNCNELNNDHMWLLLNALIVSFYYYCFLTIYDKLNITSVIFNCFIKHGSKIEY